jgi:hypothetical protein
VDAYASHLAILLSIIAIGCGNSILGTHDYNNDSRSDSNNNSLGGRHLSEQDKFTIEVPRVSSIIFFEKNFNSQNS